MPTQRNQKPRWMPISRPTTYPSTYLPTATSLASVTHPSDPTPSLLLPSLPLPAGWLVGPAPPLLPSRLVPSPAVKRRRHPSTEDRNATVTNSGLPFRRVPSERHHGRSYVDWLVGIKRIFGPIERVVGLHVWYGSAAGNDGRGRLFDAGERWIGGGGGGGHGQVNM
ncbi:uncharacterized protein BKA78DRAFT_309752 [Phyllosticta capitalensis]|uniref:uncharacterized protein n=1 Tax=Phyllosticta capitalensis TaxID=121624 RepID=UPI00312D0391